MSERPVDRAPQSPWKASYFWMRDQRDEALALAEAAEARVVLLETQLEAVKQLLAISVGASSVEVTNDPGSSIGRTPRFGRGEEGSIPSPGAAVSVADSGPAPHPCPSGDDCALNSGAVHCFACRRNWPRDETWDLPFDLRPMLSRGPEEKKP